MNNEIDAPYQLLGLLGRFKKVQSSLHNHFKQFFGKRRLKIVL